MGNVCRLHSPPAVCPHMSITERIAKVNEQIRLLELRHRKQKEKTERLLMKIEQLLKKIK